MSELPNWLLNTAQIVGLFMLYVVGVILTLAMLGFIVTGLKLLRDRISK